VKNCMEQSAELKGQNNRRNRITLSAMRHALCLLGTMLLALSVPAEARQRAKIARIGFLSPGFGAVPKPFHQRLEELGYVQGKNIVIEYRSAEGKLDRLPDLAAELVRLEVQLIVAVATPAADAAKHATTTIPIVMVDVGDPVATGLVTNLARPSGNITGVATLSPELSGKRLELLKEAVSNASRIAVLSNPTSRTNPLQLKQVQVAAPALAVRIQPLEVSKSEDFEAAFGAMVRERADAFMVLPDPVLNAQRATVVSLAAKHRLPGIYDRRAYADAGGLMTYGPNFPDLLRRAAVYVDKILKGAKPGDLPVEQPTKFELIINLKTAKQIGLTIPPNVLARADRVLK
jgi:putative tryptophan/tyrosine transport system substrate-binding protein